MKKYLLSLGLVFAGLGVSTVFAAMPNEHYKGLRSTEVVVNNLGNVNLSTVASVYMYDYTVLSTGAWNNKLRIYDTTESTTAAVAAGMPRYENLPTNALAGTNIPLDIELSSGAAVVITDDTTTVGETVRVLIRYWLVRLHNN